jgi:hypothetical protein
MQRGDTSIPMDATVDTKRFVNPKISRSTLRSSYILIFKLPKIQFRSYIIQTGRSTTGVFPYTIRRIFTMKCTTRITGECCLG